jgi:phosphoglycerol transferase MdoB-like AlkP superfamily enzyme
MSKESSTSSELSGFTLLGIAFIVLKLCHVIDWSWWWVTIPLWGGFALIIFIILIYIVLSVIFK